MKSERVCVLGLGYVGLPTACLLAESGARVLGVDVDGEVVRRVAAGRAPFREPGLDARLAAVVARGALRVASQPGPADVFLIAVPTPFKEGHAPDLSHVEAAARALAPRLRPGNLVVLESTSPVGATQQLVRWLAAERPDLRGPDRDGGASEISVAYCPERVQPGSILAGLVAQDRVVGGVSPACAERAARLYGRFVRGACQCTDARTAELTKLTENAWRDVSVAFANELAGVCDHLGLDVWELIGLANRHPHVRLLRPGPGVGGHCVAVDPWFLVHAAPDLTPLLRAARGVNDARPSKVVEQVMRAVERHPAPVIACLGLAYKANVGDSRESAAVKVVRGLAERRAGRLLAVDPHLDALPRELAGHEVEHSGLEEALSAADVVVLLVDHREFRAVDPTALAGKEIVDLHGLWGQPDSASASSASKPG